MLWVRKKSERELKNGCGSIIQSMKTNENGMKQAHEEQTKKTCRDIFFRIHCSWNELKLNAKKKKKKIGNVNFIRKIGVWGVKCWLKCAEWNVKMFICTIFFELSQLECDRVRRFLLVIWKQWCIFSIVDFAVDGFCYCGVCAVGNFVFFLNVLVMNSMIITLYVL